MFSRRRFLKSAAAASAPLALSFRVHADDKAGTRPPVVGVEGYRYECLHGWGELPRKLNWQTTHGVAVDAAGNLYVTHQGYGPDVMDTVVVFDPLGKFIRSFGKAQHGGGHGIDLRLENGEEFLYLCDFAHGSAAKTTTKGEMLWTMTLPKESNVYGNGKAYKPTNVAFAPDGGFWIADGYGSNFIHRFDHTGQWRQTFGGTGDAAGQFKTPHGIWLDSRGAEPRLVVADRANARLQWLTLEGKPLSMSKDVSYPAHFDVRGDVLLVPDLHARVSLFGKNDQPIVHLGDDPSWTAEVKRMKIRNDPNAWPAGKFVHPHDACFDAEGNIFVAEWVRTGRLTKLRRVS